jgi:hypothetical protein
MSERHAPNERDAVSVPKFSCLEREREREREQNQRDYSPPIEDLETAAKGFRSAALLKNAYAYQSDIIHA